MTVECPSFPNGGEQSCKGIACSRRDCWLSRQYSAAECSWCPPRPRSHEVTAPRGTTQDLSRPPVQYKQIMLIAVTTDAVAAIVFGEEVERGTKYRFRCLQKGWNGEIIGEGTVSEKYTDGKYDGGKLTIVAGPIRIGWSACGDGQGWVYYQPEKMRLQIASAARFQDEDKNAGQDSIRIEKLDLKRFFNQP